MHAGKKQPWGRRAPGASRDCSGGPLEDPAGWRGGVWEVMRGSGQWCQGALGGSGRFWEVLAGWPQSSVSRRHAPFGTHHWLQQKNSCEDSDEWPTDRLPTATATAPAAPPTIRHAPRRPLIPRDNRQLTATPRRPHQPCHRHQLPRPCQPWPALKALPRNFNIPWLWLLGVPTGKEYEGGSPGQPPPGSSHGSLMFCGVQILPYILLSNSP